jgi:hypothetical protein
MKVVARHGMIQDKLTAFYAEFDVIISGLDNVEARRWLNATLVGLVEVDEGGDPTDPSQNCSLHLRDFRDKLVSLFPASLAALNAFCWNGTIFCSQLP